jgi:hypothetical protein
MPEHRRVHVDLVGDRSFGDRLRFVPQRTGLSTTELIRRVGDRTSDP